MCKQFLQCHRTHWRVRCQGGNLYFSYLYLLRPDIKVLKSNLGLFPNPLWIGRFAIPHKSPWHGGFQDGVVPIVWRWAMKAFVITTNPNSVLISAILREKPVFFNSCGYKLCPLLIQHKLTVSWATSVSDPGILTNRPASRYQTTPETHHCAWCVTWNNK